MRCSNILHNIPDSIKSEIFEDLISCSGVRIERIISQGHKSPSAGWYDQDENEWVIVIEGKAMIEFDNGDSVALNRGDYVNIRSHCKHRVSWTDPDQPTVWLAVFYSEAL